MSASNPPVVDVENKTVNYIGITFNIRPLTEDSYTILDAGVPVGRAVYSFGANGVRETERPEVTDDVVQAIAEAWFAAIES